MRPHRRGERWFDTERRTPATLPEAWDTTSQHGWNRIRHAVDLHRNQGTRWPHAPVPAVIHCPKCEGQHVDKGRYAVTPGEWYRPHASHLCEFCGEVFRSEKYITVGVATPPPGTPHLMLDWHWTSPLMDHVRETIARFERQEMLDASSPGRGIVYSDHALDILKKWGF